jgi:hypothetical protein
VYNVYIYTYIFDLRRLCFLNPPYFLSRSEVESISWSRVSHQLRTFDLTVEVTQGMKIEFSMLEKEEIPSITKFVHFFATLKKEDEKKQQQQEQLPASSSQLLNDSIQTHKTKDEECDDDDEDSDFVCNMEDSEDEDDGAWGESETCSDTDMVSDENETGEETEDEEDDADDDDATM